MDKEFKPTRESLHIRLLWLAWPIALIACIDYIEWLSGLGVFEKPHDLVHLIIIIGVVIGVRQAVLNQGQKLRFQPGQLVITDYFGQVRVFFFDRICNPGIEGNKKKSFFRWEVFIFSYQDEGNIQYRLSDLSENDRFEVIKILVKLFPEIGKDLQSY